MNPLSASDRALGRDVLQLLAAVRDSDALDPFSLEAFGIAIHTGMLNVDYTGGVFRAVYSLTPEGFQVLCLAEHGGVAMP